MISISSTFKAILFFRAQIAQVWHCHVSAPNIFRGQAAADLFSVPISLALTTGMYCIESLGGWR
jgi:hypothetical protein